MDRLCDFNLTLEVLEGCGYHCGGCTVDKEHTPDLVTTDTTQRLLALVDDLHANEFRPFEFSMAPTDILSAKNGLAVLDTPLIRGMAERFDSMVLTLALLREEGLRELAEKADALMAGKWIRLVVPITVKNSTNDKYISLLRERVLYFNSFLKKSKIRSVYLTVNMYRDNMQLINPEYHKKVMSINLGVRTITDYTFTHSRKGFTNLLVLEEFKRDIYKFTQLVADNDSKFVGHLLHDPFDGVELCYRDGKLYHIPVLMEKFPIFDPFYVIPEPWCTDTVVEYKQNHYFENLGKFTEHTECGDCCHLNVCTHGDLHTTMRYLKIDHCPLGIKNRHDLTREYGKELQYCGTELNKLLSSRQES